MSHLLDVQQFIEASRKVRNARELEALIAAITLDMGFDYYALVHHVDLRRYNPDLRHMVPGGLIALSNYPEAWVETYQQRNIVTRDPILVASTRTGVGFVWEDMGKFIEITPLHRAITEATRRAGLMQGFTVPAHVPGQTNGTCNFAVGRERALPTANLPLAQLIGSFAFEAARSLVQRTLEKQDRPTKRKLGNRQLECLALMAQGKSDWEIGRILGISDLTVKRHFKLARELYDVPRSVQVLLRAIHEGQIALSDVLP
ncbi:helix-turn-helix transcriptional regulator [Rhizorhapis suberifaciens]|uniref:LuxR family quorum-sensing system transcriptional regulator CciR n=1 Tax=Rhizorhapis suberifaciens TaxID=13656 RepID=A0A840HWE2_9SPHN|nr:LuxR family transcriptional regulator [Rhizorhapis suberifaciens]MBB4642642.1 LuxR family quorum-sensing system transcriptional regulator CciR [Rhizorhapis suberifaciens]